MWVSAPSLQNSNFQLLVASDHRNQTKHKKFLQKRATVKSSQVRPEGIQNKTRGAQLNRRPSRPREANTESTRSTQAEPTNSHFGPTIQNRQKFLSLSIYFLLFRSLTNSSQPQTRRTSPPKIGNFPAQNPPTTLETRRTTTARPPRDKRRRRRRG